MPLSSDEPVDPRHHWRFQEVMDERMLRVRRCISAFREPIDFAVAADITAARTFSSVLAEDLERNADLIAGDADALATVAQIREMASGAVGCSTELQSRALNAEIVNEAENEQEKQKQKEQEEQSQIRFSREDEQQRSWKIFELARPAPTQQDPALSRSSSVSLSLGAPATVKDGHPFYPFSAFSVRGVNEQDIDLPSHIMCSSNYFRPECQLAREETSE